MWISGISMYCTAEWSGCRYLLKQLWILGDLADVGRKINRGWVECGY